MKYQDYERALSIPRIGKYLLACNGDKNKALILYRYNIKLCQKFYGILCVLEVALRNAIDTHFRAQLGDSNWIESQMRLGFLVDNREAISKERNKLKQYTHDRLVASLSLGVWTMMFSRKSYRGSGKTLLQIFPGKAHGMNQQAVYDELDKIRVFRNRIAHHEPVCFDRSGIVNLVYAKEIHTLILKYIMFLGYKTNELLYGVEDPLSIIIKVDELSKMI